MRFLLTALLVLLTLSSSARAGDRLEVLRVAFSPYGTRALVVTGGVQDGSGFSVAALTALGTGQGQRLLEAGARSETAPVPALVKVLLARERPRLLPLDLVPGVTARPVYARTFPTQAPDWAEGTRAGSSATTPVRLWTRPVPVRLTVRPLPAQCPYLGLLPPGERPAGFTLTVNGQTVHDDHTLPLERRCAARYALDRVYVKGNRAVFIVRAYTPGFEGPNAEVVVVAAKLR
ncbi:DUF2259 domain-containing protein [Deinococcus metallilatus]|uniref:DUF2259 domain-containing protein n=1 Tax=Deinococcus metallilatus TaxID=1211322 RepID=A0AAJ5F210_9DEIO|nr:DUF2259 domain-containing protein [Deinococcus metallilatus]MBB5294322.1 putative secreted protein [Deinococcus metallilatus]QBY09094.1 DUF2259 domain-containing protein [Deinococcus metallilatus]RXJ10238.1 DUF2259 domain-containing protein [Deinococcus metallilatus]TLK22530.1 DUF2259 domain-containing protein [Deinococcus metallilatus]GMA16341.1 hypothetical protein GCM10025871_26720 [Deinococcus metallilatus]